jgi:hypothetical protein
MKFVSFTFEASGPVRATILLIPLAIASSLAITNPPI